MCLGALSNHHFDNVLFPLRTPHDEYLPRYAAKLDCFELAQLYHTDELNDTVSRWIEQAPDGFRFHPKLWRQACNPQDKLDNDLPWDDAALDAARTSLDIMEPMRERGNLGNIVVQMPPRFRNTPEHLDWLDELLDMEAPGAFVIQLQDASWWTDEVEAFLRKRKTQLVWATPKKDAPPRWTTGSEGYVRLTGSAYPNKHTRGRPVHREDRLDALLELRAALAETPWDTCTIACLNPFEGNAIDSLPRVAAALVDKELGHTLARRPGDALLKDSLGGPAQSGLGAFA